MFSVDRFFWTIGSHGNELGTGEENPQSVCVWPSLFAMKCPAPRPHRAQGATGGNMVSVWLPTPSTASGLYSRSSQRLLLESCAHPIPWFKAVFSSHYLDSFAWEGDARELSGRPVGDVITHKISQWLACQIPLGKRKASDLTDNRKERSLQMDFNVS